MELNKRYDNQGHAIIAVTFNKEEVMKYSDATVEELAKNVQIKGFRKGKVDLSLARRYISNEDFSNSLINRLIRKSLKAINTNAEISNEVYNKMILNAEPKFEIKKIDNDEAIIEVSILLAPQVTKLGEYKNLALEYEVSKVKKEDVEKELDSLRREAGFLEETSEPIVEKDHVSLKINLFINNEKRKDLEQNSIEIDVGSHKSMLGTHEDELVNKKVGDEGSIVFDTDDTYPEILRNSHVEIKYEITQVQRANLPELNDELATLQTTYKDVENLQQLKDKIKERLQERVDRNNKERKLSAIIEKIVETSEIEYAKNDLKSELVKIQTRRDSQELSNQGISLDDYLKFNKMSKEEYENRVFNYLFKPLCQSAVYKKIVELNQDVFKEIKKEDVAKRNNIEDFDKFVNDMSQQYISAGYTVEQAQSQMNQLVNNMFNDYRTNEILDFLLENNK